MTISFSAEHEVELEATFTKLEPFFKRLVELSKGTNGYKSAKPQPSKVVSEEKLCPIHQEPLEKKWSEKKQKSYWAHNMGKSLCFGN